MVVGFDCVARCLVNNTGFNGASAIGDDSCHWYDSLRDCCEHCVSLYDSVCCV